MWLTTGWHSSACIRFVQQTIRLRGRVSLRAATLAEPVEVARRSSVQRTLWQAQGTGASQLKRAYLLNNQW